MALRVLTDVEKQELKSNSLFLEKCQWAIRDYASYWAIHDGSGLDATGRIKWAKDRLKAVDITLNDTNDPAIALKFCKLAKGMQFNLAASPDTAANIIAAMVAGNKFEELTSMYFDMLGESVNFSISGN
jgi:hypothetical protein